LSLYIATSQMLKDSVFIMGRYFYEHIYNVSHNSLICLMIGAARNKTIRLRVKF